MDSNNNDDSDDNINTAMNYLRRPYNPSNCTDMLTIRTGWIRTVHRAAQAYLHQMNSASSAGNITEQDILYAYIWHLLTRARVRGAGADLAVKTVDDDAMEVIKLLTTVDVHDVLLPSPNHEDHDPNPSTYLNNLPLPLPAIAACTVPLRSFFLRPLVTDETGIPYLRRYALLALAIRSAIDEAVREPSSGVRSRLGLLKEHWERQWQRQGQEVAPRRAMAAKWDWVERCEGGLCIVSLDEAGKGGLEGMGMRCGGSYGRGRSEVGSDFSSMYSSGEETEMGVGIHTKYKPSTPARGDYHAVVLPVRKGDGKWGVQLHLHPLDRQWLRRWMEENPEEADIVPKV